MTGRMPRDPLKHYHKACVACLHKVAHGTFDGYGLALLALLRAGYDDAAAFLDRTRARTVNRAVRDLARIIGIDAADFDRLMRHHGVRRK